MRILTFLHSFEPGGVERIALRLVRQWRAAGIDAPLYMGRIDGEMAGDVGQGLPVITAPRPPLDTAWWETIWMIVTLPAVIRRVRPDVLFCAGNTYAVVAVAMKAWLRADCPPIVAKVSNDLERRDMSAFGRFWYRLWLWLVGRIIDQVIGMEDPAFAEIRRFLGTPADRIAIVPDPALSLDMIEIARRPLADRRPLIAGRRYVSVGRLVTQKNLPLMLRAFSAAARPEDDLTIIGDGPERPRLERLAQRLGIADRVIFTGYVPAPITLLNRFDVLLLSSHYEGVPAAVIEAIAAGLTIVATDCSRSMGALLLHQQLGVLVPVADEAALVAAIARAQPGTISPHLSRAQAERFTIEHAAHRYLAIMAGHRHPTPTPQRAFRAMANRPFALAAHAAEAREFLPPAVEDLRATREVPTI